MDGTFLGWLPKMSMAMLAPQKNSRLTRMFEWILKKRYKQRLKSVRRNDSVSLIAVCADEILKLILMKEGAALIANANSSQKHSCLQ